MAGELLRESLTHCVKELYTSEQHQLRTLPALLAAATTPHLKRTLKSHLRETAQQTRRLEHVFTLLDEPIRWVRCSGVLGILEECQGAMEDHADGAVRDAAIIATAQRLDYYEMAAYGAAAAWADTLGLTAVAELLNQCLDEEIAAADELLAVALTRVHLAAGHAAAPAGRSTASAPVAADA